MDDLKRNDASLQGFWLGSYILSSMGRLSVWNPEGQRCGEEEWKWPWFIISNSMWLLELSFHSRYLSSFGTTLKRNYSYTLSSSCKQAEARLHPPHRTEIHALLLKLLKAKQNRNLPFWKKIWSFQISTPVIPLRTRKECLRWASWFIKFLTKEEEKKTLRCIVEAASAYGRWASRAHGESFHNFLSAAFFMVRELEHV